MAKLIIAIGIASAIAAQSSRPTHESDLLWNAITWQESTHNPTARGDYRGVSPNRKPTAFGIAQIRQAYLDDANHWLSQHKLATYSMADMDDPTKARAVFNAYMSRYAKGGSAEQIARRHNGGPTGDRKQSTVKYWEKVKSHMANKPWENQNHD